MVLFVVLYGASMLAQCDVCAMQCPCLKTKKGGLPMLMLGSFVVVVLLGQIR